MPALSHPKYEAYAIHRAGGCSKTEAAKRAGFPERSAHNEGCRIGKRPEVVARVAELSELHENTESEAPGSALEKFISLPSVISEVVSIQKAASAARQYSVALGCQQYLGKLGRLTPDANPAPAGPRSLTQINLSTMTAKDLSVFLRDQVKALPAADRKELESVIDISPAAVDPVEDLL